MADELSEAWDALYAALPVGFVVGRPSKSDEEAERPWHVVVTDLRSNALRKEYVEATGWTEAEALRDLAGLLKEWDVEQTG